MKNIIKVSLGLLPLTIMACSVLFDTPDISSTKVPTKEKPPTAVAPITTKVPTKEKPPTVMAPITTTTPLSYFPGLIVFPRIRMEYYDIEGATRETLLDEMEKKGPIAGLKHEHSIAAMEYDLLYTWPGRGTAECDPTKGEIWYTLKVYAPRWSPPSDTSPELIEAWIVFMDGVKAHEEGHIQLVRDYFAAMMKVITTARTCSEAWDIANGFEQDLHRAQLKYDREVEPTIFP